MRLCGGRWWETEDFSSVVGWLGGREGKKLLSNALNGEKEMQGDKKSEEREKKKSGGVWGERLVCFVVFFCLGHVQLLLLLLVGNTKNKCGNSDEKIGCLEWWW